MVGGGGSATLWNFSQVSALFNLKDLLIAPYNCSIHITHISSFLLFQIDKGMTMFINLRSSEAVHANLLQEALDSFDENKG